MRLCYVFLLIHMMVLYLFICYVVVIFQSSIEMLTCPFCPSGDVHWRIVSVYLDKNSQVCCITVKKIREIVQLSEWKQNAKFCSSIKRWGESNAKMWHMCCEPSIISLCFFNANERLFVTPFVFERWWWNLRVNTWVLPW